MKGLTALQEMAVSDLFTYGSLIRDRVTENYQGFINEYNPGVIRALITKGYARVTAEGRWHYPLRVTANPFPDALGLCYGFIPTFWLLEGDRPEKFL